MAQIPPAYRSDILVTIEGADASDAVIEHLTKVEHREGARSAGPPGGLLDRLAGRTPPRRSASRRVRATVQRVLDSISARLQSC